MVFLEITKNNIKQHLDKVNKQLAKKDGKLFVLIYMEGCGPCNETRPEWAKLKNVLSKQDDDDIMVAAIDKDVIDQFGKIAEPAGFPTMRYITNAGDTVEAYEDADIPTKDRSIDSFVEWIQSKAHQHTGGRRRRRRTRRRTRRNRRTRRRHYR